MINVQTQSRLARQTILEKAVRYFGPEGLDLEVAEQSECSARFKGRGGFVSIALEFQVASKRTHVTAISRTFGPQMHAFIGTL